MLAIIVIAVVVMTMKCKDNKPEGYYVVPSEFQVGVANVPSAAIFGNQSSKQQQAMNLQKRLGGFGTPVRNFNDVPALQQLQRLNNQRQLSNATIGNMYLSTANSGRVKNMM